jgi:glycerophosphoryl diester phosphodiesterase
MGLEAVSLDWRSISDEVVEAAHDAGLKVYSWHKEYGITHEKLATGLDGLITDHPARARKVIEGLEL